MIGRILARIENLDLSFWQLLLLPSIAIFLRTFIENFVNVNNSGHLSSFLDTFFHYPFWFFAVFLSLAVILCFVAKMPVKKVANFVAIGSFLILLPPFVDLIVAGKEATLYNFVVSDVQGLWQRFISILWEAKSIGTGIKLEVSIALVGVLGYVFWRTRSWWRSLLSAGLLYVAIFIMLTLPVYLFFAGGGSAQTLEPQNVHTFFFEEEIESSSTLPRTFIMGQGVYQPEPARVAAHYYGIPFASAALIIDIILLGALFYYYNKKKLRLTLSNLRPTRIGIYLTLLAVGIVSGVYYQTFSPPSTLFDVISIINMSLAFIFAWLFAVWDNDQVDAPADKVNESERPLATGSFSNTEWRNMKGLFFVFSVLFGILASWYTLVFVLLFMAVYHIYSVPPFWFKQYTGISSLLIAFNVLLVVWAGFFMTAGTEYLFAFPGWRSLGILLVGLSAEPIKTIKDIKGDAYAGVKTLPVLFGEKQGKKIIGVLAGLSIVFFAVFFFPAIQGLITALVFALLIYLTIQRTPFNEHLVFGIYFVFIVAIALELATFHGIF